jgi:hypothetical protein
VRNRVQQDPSAEPGRETGLVVQGLDQGTAEFGRTFLPLARRFDLTRFSFAGRAADGGVLYEYLPAGETRDDWTHLGSLHIVRVGQTFEDSAPIVPKLAAAIMRSGVEVHEAGSYPGSAGGVYFLHYTIASGPLREEGLSAVWAVLPGHIANFQEMNRAEPYSAHQVEYFKSVAASLARPN